MFSVQLDRRGRASDLTHLPMGDQCVPEFEPINAFGRNYPTNRHVCFSCGCVSKWQHFLLCLLKFVISQVIHSNQHHRFG